MSNQDNREYLIKVYNIYANQYNKASNKIDITNSLSDRCDKINSDLQAIRDRLEKHGFTPEDITEIAKAVRDDDESKLQLIKKGLQAFANHFNYSKEEGEQALKEVEENARKYELLEANLLIIDHVIHTTGKKGYPDNIPLWDELAEGEKEKIKLTGSLLFPEGQYQLYQELYHKYPDKTWEEVFETFCNEIEKQTGQSFNEDYGRFHDRFKKWRSKN